MATGEGCDVARYHSVAVQASEAGVRREEDGEGRGGAGSQRRQEQMAVAS